jgi:hypothetical protein
MAEVVPFPRCRDRRYVRKQAAVMASYSHPAAEKFLQTQLDLQTRTMAKRGIAPELIAEQVRALECAIRAELWRIVMQPGQPGGAA